MLAPLLERDTVLATLEAVPEGSTVLLAGEAGIGKTSLLRALAGRTGARVLWGACDPLFTPRPLAPLADIAAAAAARDLGERIAGGAPPGELLGPLIDELGREPTLLVVEDLHWVDEGTLDVLRLLARRIAGLPVVLVASYRDDELGAGHPLRIWLGEIAARRLSLEPLSREAVLGLAASHAVDGEQLHAVTGGNPFYVTEVLATPGGAVPATVRDAVLGRAARLGAGGRAVLERVAVVPGPSEGWLLEDAADADVDECLRSGILRPRGAAVAFRHELARLAVEEAVPLRRRRALHRDVLAALTRRGADPARLAHHAEAADDAAAVRRHAPLAAERAARAGAHREAAAQYGRALRFADGLDAAERAELLEQRGYQCYLTDQVEAAIVARAEALELRRGLGDRLREGDGRRLLSRLHWFVGRNAEAERFAAEAVELLEGLEPGHELAMAYSNRAQLAMLAGDVAATRRWGRAAIDLAERLGDAEVLAHALNNVGSAEGIAGDAGGQALIERSLAIALEGGLEEHAARAHCNLVGIEAMQRRPVEAIGRSGAALRYCTERGLGSWERYILAWRAVAEVDAGDWDAAAATSDEILRDPGTAPISRIPALVALATLRVRRGDPSVDGVLDEALALARSTGELQRLAPVACVHAERAWIEGEDAAALAATEQAWALVLERDEPWTLGELAVWRRRAGGEDAVAGATGPHALELGGDLEGAAAAWDARGCVYDAAFARARAGSAQGFAELERLGADAVLRRLGRRGPRAGTKANPAGLTSRELEVLALVAEGLRNTEIAERLVLSVRTVDMHVRNILRKLGVRSRALASVEAARLGIRP